MKIKILLFGYLMLCPFFLHSQVNFEWANNILNYSSSKIHFDSHSNILITGSKQGPFGRFDMFLIKYAQSGDISQVIVYEDTVLNTSNSAGPVLFDDSSNIFLGGSRIWKYNGAGQLIWNMYPGLYRGFGRIFFDADYNFLTSTELANSSFFIRKYSYNGDSVWSRTFKPAGTIAARWRGAVADSKDNIITSGYMDKIGVGDRYDYMTVKYSGNGDLIWANRYESGVDNINSSIAIDNSDNVYVTGGSEINNLNYNIVTLKYAPDGTTVWTRSFDGGGFDYGKDIEVDNYGNVYISGVAVGYGAILLKYDVNGNFQWLRNQPEVSFSTQYPLLKLDKAGDPYLLFSINTTLGRYEYGMAKYDKTGTQKWLARYNYNNHYCEIYDADIDNNFNLIVTGRCGDYMTTVKWSQIITNVGSNSNQTPDNFKLYQNYPNPFNPVTQIRFDIAVQTFVEMNIYNGAGQLVKVLVSDIKSAGNYNITFDASGLPSGVYFYRLRAGDFMDSKRFVLLK